MGYARDNIIQVAANSIQWEFCQPGYLHEKAVNNFMQSGMNLEYKAAEPVTRRGGRPDRA